MSTSSDTRPVEPQQQEKPLYVKPLPRLPITYEQFLEWADEDTLAEW